MELDRVAFFLSIVAILFSVVFGISEDAEPAYAEGYFHSYTTPFNVSIAVSNIYYDLTNYTMTFAENFLITENGVVAENEGLYKLSGTMSFEGGNGGLYEIELHRNNVTVPSCAFFLTTSNSDTRNGAINCLIYLYAGDALKIKVKDMKNPPQNIYVRQMNFNIRT